MKEIFKKITSLVLLFVTIFSTVLNPLIVCAISSDYTDEAIKGDVYDPIKNNYGTNINNKSTIVAGDVFKQGDVKMTKTVTKKNDTGLYTVEITVEGKDYTDEIPLPVYTVFVLDASSSMAKNDNAPWNNAKEAAVEFSKKLTAIKDKNGNKINQISLITFDAGTLVNTGFSTTAFTDSSFQTTGKGTNYNAGLYPAYLKLKEFRKTHPDDIVNVVFISDGSPNKSSCKVPANDPEFCNRYDGSYAANLIKSKEINAKIYSLSYNYSDGTYLKNISSGGKIYKSNSDNITTILNEILKNEILTQPAAINAKVYDMIGPNFTFVESNTNTQGVTFDKDTKVVTYNIGAINEYMDANKTQKAVYKFQFDIQIDVDSENGWYQTNNTNLVKVTNTYNNQETTLVEIDKTAEVYWEKQKYPYSIEYYYDNVKDNDRTDYGSAVKDEIVSVTYQQIQENLKKGYSFSSISPDNQYITIKNNGENVIRVYYVSNNYDYIIKHVELGNESNVLATDEGEAKFESKVPVLEKEFTGFRYDSKDKEFIIIDVEKNEATVYYTKNIYDYTIYHVEKNNETNILETEASSANYQDVIDVKEKEFAGFTYDSKDKESIKIDTENNVAYVYYTRNIYDYTIYHVEKDNENNILDTESNSADFEDVIEVKEKEFTGFTYDSKDKETIEIDIENNVAYVYYTRNNYKYTVEYYKENLEGEFEIVEEDTKVYENVLFESETTYEVNEYEGFTYDETKTINAGSKVPANNDLVIRLYYTLDESEVIVHYVVKVEDNYIPFDVYGRDEFGNNTPDFVGIELEDSIFTGKIGSEFTTIYRVVPEYTLVGIYNGNILNETNLEKLEGSEITSTIEVNTKEYTYVYEAPMGDYEELPPQTGLEQTFNYINYIMLLAVVYILKKYFKLINTK